jgi:hypothetical protein
MTGIRLPIPSLPRLGRRMHGAFMACTGLSSKQSPDAAHFHGTAFDFKRNATNIWEPRNMEFLRFLSEDGASVQLNWDFVGLDAFKPRASQSATFIPAIVGNDTSELDGVCDAERRGEEKLVV